MFKFYLPHYTQTKNYEEFNIHLQLNEKIPTEPGIPLKHQELISNLMKGSTNVESLLLVHDMGTGKTCTAVNAIEENLKDNNYGMTQAIILNRGKSIMNNFINELVNKCTTKYKISNEKVQKKLWSKFYQFDTFEIFAKKIANMSDNQIKEKYNNIFFVIDEVHNILNDESNVYQQINRFINLIKNKKILLLTGTPVKDVPEDFIPIINLLLKDEEKINIKNFRSEYYDSYGNLNDKLRLKIHNKVSYLSSAEPEIQIKYNGNKILELKKFIVTPHIMSEFQNKFYNIAYLKDTSSGGIYNNSRQAVRFVFPDGSYGIEGYNNFINDKKYTFKSVMMTELRKYGNDVNSIIRRISDFSVKYAYIIQKILDADKKGEKTIVYDDLVKGSGLILFNMLLNFIGFKKHRLITSETTTIVEISKIQKIFNSDPHGKSISVILGSKVIAEGFTFLDVVHEHIVPHWNNTETMQVVARGIRIGSHTMLLSENSNVVINIYRHVSLCKNQKNSIDYIMTKLSEEKDIEINKIINIIKESSITCNEFLNRNKGKCFSPFPKNYDFSNIISVGFFKNEKIIEILNIFKKNNIITLEKLNTMLPHFYKEEILKYLYKIISEKIYFINKINSKCYINNNMDVFFVTDEITNNKDIYLSNYTTNVKPYSSNNIENFENAINVEIVDLNSNQNIQRLLEMALTVELLDLNTKYPEKVKEILKIYQDNYYIDKKNKAVSCWYLSDIVEEKAVPTCLINPQTDKPWREWKKCPRKLINEIIEKRNQQIKNFENAVLNQGIYHYGLWNPNNNEFCIKKIDPNESDDKRTIASGKRCVNWNKQDLINIAEELNIEDWDKWTEFNRTNICNNLKNYFDQNNLSVENKSCGLQTKKK